MTVRAVQTNFSRGELGPQLYARWDVDAWQAAVKQARNVIVLKYGGLTKRPGTELVAEVIDSTQDTRLIPFQFSLDQAYAIEFGQGYISPCANGGRVLEEELVITAISNAAQAQVTAAYHGYVAGNKVYILGVDGEMGELLNGRFWPVVAVIDANNFTIDANTLGLDPFTTADGGITRGAPIVPPVDPTVPAVVVPPAPPDVSIGAPEHWWEFYDPYVY